MHFMLSTMSVVYVLTTPMPKDGGEIPTVEQVWKRAKWDNDDYVCRGLILNAKYMAEDASGKKFLVSNFTNYKMTDLRPVLEQYNELLGILKSHLRIEESFRVQDSDKPKGNNVAGPSVINMVEHNNSSRYNDNKGKRKHHDTIANPNKKPKVTCWKCGKPGHLKKNCKVGNVGNRANGSSIKGSEDGSSNPLKGQSMFSKSHQIYYLTYVSKAFFMHDDDVAWWVDSEATVHVCKDRCWEAVRLPDPKLKTLGERGIECIFVGYAEHSKAFRFYVIEPNDSVAINSITESKDAIFDEHKFSSQSEPQLRKNKRHRTPKDFRPEFQIYLIKGTRDDVFDQYSYCFNVEDDLKTFDEAMKSQDMDVKTTFLNRELKEDVYMNQPLGSIMPGNENKVDLTKEFLSSRFSMNDMGEADVILGIRIKHESNGIAISQSHSLEKVLKKFNYSDCNPVSTPLDTCEKLMPNRVLEGYTDASWISNTEDNSSTSGWVFLLGGAAGKEAEWLKNLLFEISLWVKPIAPIAIRCYSAATLAKAYSQMYNDTQLPAEKSWQLSLMWKDEHSEGRSTCFTNHPKDVLEPAERRMKLLTYQWKVVSDEVQRVRSLNGIHQWSRRKYPQWVSSSEVVSVLNYQRLCSSAGYNHG
nr:hypothetical protein [Tanacetum cinerariifolium]